MNENLNNKNKESSENEALKTSQTIVEEIQDDKEKDAKSKDKKNKKHRPKAGIDFELVRYFDVDPKKGLEEAQVTERKEHFLINEKIEDKGKTIPQIIMSNLFTFFNILCFAVGVAMVVVQSYENLVFLIVIVLNILIGIIQEIKAKKTVERLTLLSSPMAVVIRDGEKITIPTDEVVLDDIVYFVGGKQIYSDCVVIEGGVEVDESLLTGESDAVVKRKGDILLSGSFVISGTTYARVDKVGRDNYIEKLAQDVKKYSRPNSQLLRSLNGVIKIIGIIIIPLAVGAYFLSNQQLDDHSSITRTAGSMIGMIPAGLFLLTSMSLAVGVVRLGKSNTLVQELYAIETLARTDVLCLDKTGTITDGTMRVVDMLEVKNHTDYTVRELVSSMMFAFEEHNATSIALSNFFGKAEIIEATSFIPFSSIRKYSAVTFGKQGTFILGAPEYVIGDQYDKIRGRVERFAEQGGRVLVLAHVFGTLKANEKPKNARAISMIVIEDHIREDAIETIAQFKATGVEVKVISGDNPITVSKIAKRAGIDEADRYISLDGLSDKEVAEAAIEYTVFGRVSPTQKKIIVNALQAQKKTVAMTGDGVNDILALKEADCSIAMASGSEATRYVSHLVLMDSKFSSMPKVVNEGRRVINNIQLTSTLFLTKTVMSVLLTLLFIAIQSPYPFEPIQLFLIEFFAIGFPSFFLALQPNTNPIKGNFIVNVLKRTVPAALVILIINVLILYLNPVLNSAYMTDPELLANFTTLAILSTSAIALLVLYQVSLPFNLLRGILFFLMVSGAIATVYITKDVLPSNPLKLTDLDAKNIIFMIALVLGGQSVMGFVERLLKKINFM